MSRSSGELGRGLNPGPHPAFVFTDIIATGLFCLGQLIELQAQRSPAERVL